jgi:FG-GAP repeat
MSMKTTRLLTALLTAAAFTALPIGLAGAQPAAAPVAVPQAVPATTATPDFNGDGLADLASTLDDDIDFGRIQVRYGSGAPVKLGLASRLLARNLNGDGYTDLVTVQTDGTVGVMFGSATGLDAAASHTFGATAIGAGYAPTDLALVEAPTPRLVLAANRSDHRGKLVTYPLGSDGLPTAPPSVLQPGTGKVPNLGTKHVFLQALASAGNRLFVGAPYVTVAGRAQAGAVVVLSFGTGGATAGKLITQNSSGVGSSPSKYGYFGYSVAARDGYLAVGARGDGVGGRKQSGSVQLFRFSATKVTPVRRITQASAGVPGKAERYDFFGTSVALGAVCDGRAAVIVGGPGEVITPGHQGDGSVWIIPLVRSSACPAQQLYEGHGLPGQPTYFRFLGLAVAVLRDAGDTVDRVAISGYGSYSEGPIGLLTIWSAKTQTVSLSTEEFARYLAGR